MYILYAVYIHVTIFFFFLLLFLFYMYTIGERACLSHASRASRLSYSIYII